MTDTTQPDSVRAISHQRIATALEMNELDLRILRRHCGGPEPIRYRGINHFECDAIIAFLRRILLRVAPKAELAIRVGAIDIEVAK